MEMKNHVLRKKLNTYINQADTVTLEALYTLLKPDNSVQRSAYWDDPDFLTKLEEGVEEYEQYRHDLNTWEIIKNRIQ